MAVAATSPVKDIVGQHPGADTDPVIIVGNGPSGVQCLVQLRRLGVRTPVLLFGKEDWAPYDRVKLSSFLAGDASFDSLSNLPPEINDNVCHFVGCAVRSIDAAAKTLIDATGTEHRYSKLVLALGSSAYVPNISGAGLSGVFRFRDMTDAHALMARTMRSRHTVIIGGGLLGIEAARALCKFNTDVTLIQHSERLMNKQLDAEAADIVRTALEAEGVRVSTQTSVKEIRGNTRVESVLLNSGEEISCDSVVFATGISPNKLLAEEAGVRVAQGIRVDEHMRTSSPDIYAIGECAQFGDQVSGLVAPGLQQARIAATDIAGAPETYAPVADTTWLKVLSLEVFSAGQFREEERFRIHQTLVYRRRKAGVYRRLMFRAGRLVGIVAIGEWPQRAQALNLLREHSRVMPWQVARFLLTGELQSSDGGDAVCDWPERIVICQCKGLTRGELSEKIAAGSSTVLQLKSATGAGTVCGGCDPLLENLCGNVSSVQRHVPGAVPLSLIALLTLIALAISWQQPVPGISDTVAGEGLFEQWSRDGWLRQISGFFLLGGSVLAMLMSLRKRISWLSFGGFSGWRIAHAVIGLVTVFALLWHTGFSLGENLNRWLMVSFLLVLTMGGLAALLAIAEARIPARWPAAVRRQSTWLHILVFWPVPVLLGFHILSAYFF